MLSAAILFRALRVNNAYQFTEMPAYIFFPELQFIHVSFMFGHKCGYFAICKC